MDRATRSRITRRSAPSTLASGIAPAASPHSGPDANLVALGSELEVAWADQKKALKRYAGIVGNDESVKAEYDRANQACKAIVARIIPTPATTLEGLRAKALAFAFCWGDDAFEAHPLETEYGESTAMEAIDSILVDLLKHQTT